MARRKHKLKELQVRLPVPTSVSRSKITDEIALEEAKKLSATPIKKFKFLGRSDSIFSNDMYDLVYSAHGTPKEG